MLWLDTAMVAALVVESPVQMVLAKTFGLELQGGAP